MKKNLPYDTPYGRELASRRRYNPNRLNALDAGLAYLIALALVEAVSAVYVAVFRPLVARGIVTDRYFLLLVGLLLPQAAILAVALVFLKVRRCSWPNGGGFASKRDAIPAAMAVLMIFGLMYSFSPLAEEFVSAIYALGGGETGTPELGGNAIFALLYLVGVAVLPAIGEEMLYRGVILRGLSEWGKAPAVFLSAVMFSFMHGSFQQMLYQFVIGVAIGWVVAETKNLALGCLMHFMNNAIAGPVALVDLLPDRLYFLSVAFGCAMGAACLIAAVYYFGKLSAARSAGKIVDPPCSLRPEANASAVSDPARPDECRFVPWHDELPLAAKGNEPLFCLGGVGWRKMNRRSSLKASLSVVAAGIFAAFGLVLVDFFTNL